MALFGEKYGDRVRVVSSRRLQQGTVRRHARRIAPAISGSARSSMKAASQPASAASKPSPAKAPCAVSRKLCSNRRSTRQSIWRNWLREKGAGAPDRADEGESGPRQVGDMESGARDIKGVKVLSAQVAGMDRGQLAHAGGFAAQTSGRPQSSCWRSAEDSNVAIVSGRDQRPDGESARGKLAGAVAQAVGGKGGGRPDMAEAGGKDPAALPARSTTSIRLWKGCSNVERFRRR